MPFSLLKCMEKLLKMIAMGHGVKEKCICPIEGIIAAQKQALDEIKGTIEEQQHATEIDVTKFSSIKDLYHERTDYTRKYYTEQEVDVIHRIVDSVPDRKTLVHGHIHPKNVMMQNDELVLIDMADVTWGHQVFDLTGMALTHVFIAKASPERCVSILGIDSQTALSLWDVILKREFQG